MIEYMLHWWGGCEKEVKEKYNYDNYLYFNSKEERDKVKKLLMKFNNLGLAFDEKDGVLSHKDTIAIVTLSYNGKAYKYEDNFGKEFPEETVRFQYEENNYSCDCNRSLFIRYHCDKNFPELNCGNEINLEKLEIIYR